MTKRKSENKIVEIQPEFENILVCNDRQMTPYVEILVQEPENISNQNLGTLIGVFEVTDTTEDSSYIVNYLISIIKKEYFSKPKRGPIESLESALHKANLALSNLAEHENIGWLGKLNVLIAVIEKNSLHLSQAGNACALLLRSKTITDVSEGLAPAKSELNPMKTFVSVSSGRLEKNDKLILTTDSIFDIFSLEEIKKSSLRFSDKNFVQFLKTALGSELERAAVLIADLKDQQEIAQPEPQKQKRDLNVFSKDAFAKTKKAKTEQNAQITQDLQKEIQYEKAGFVDEKTGHIYIKDDFQTTLAQDAGPTYTEKILQKSANLSSDTAKMAKNLAVNTLRNIRLPKFSNLQSKARKLQPDYQSIIETVRTQAKARAKTAGSASTVFIEKSTVLAKVVFSQKNGRLAIFVCKNIYHKIISLVRLALPRFDKIRDILRKMDYQQKLYVALIFVLIFIVPLVGINIKNNLDAKRAAQVAVANKPAPLPLEQDKNVLRIDTPMLIYTGNDILKTINLNNKIFVVTSSNIVDLEKNQSFAIPQEFTNPAQVAGMQDLNLIFLLNKNKQIMSFSPISTEFKNNNLTVPVDATITGMGTYLTYIYLLDSKNNQIYRYPRAEGGFGEKTNWLKETLDLSNTNGLAMNENIFISNNTGILKLFRGQKQDFSIEETATPISISKIAIGEQSGTIFILDTQNSRVIHLDGENKIVAQYYNPKINSATDITISENNNTIYISNNATTEAIAIN
ncbi:MAG: hypothetical protein Q7T51_04830 [Candidatus Moranbacteria bacterium]|nr:hypothetical protein [Candidatus Moranbacteria bacterium]